MTNQDQAVEYFSSGFNCAQSVVAVFSEAYGLDKELALKVSGGLGGGFRCGEICGAASGAVLVVGLKYGQCIPGDLEAKAICGSKTVEFLDAFRREHGSLICRELLGCDPSTAEGKAQVQSMGLSRKICANLVRSAAKLLEELDY